MMINKSVCMTIFMNLASTITVWGRPIEPLNSLGLSFWLDDSTNPEWDDSCVPLDVTHFRTLLLPLLLLFQHLTGGWIDILVVSCPVFTWPRYRRYGESRKTERNGTEWDETRRDETEATAAGDASTHSHSLEKQINTEGTKEQFKLLAQVICVLLNCTRLEEHFDTDSVCIRRWQGDQVVILKWRRISKGMIRKKLKIKGLQCMRLVYI